jgi:hypothetical protein
MLKKIISVLSILAFLFTAVSIAPKGVNAKAESKNPETKDSPETIKGMLGNNDQKAVREELEEGITLKTKKNDRADGKLALSGNVDVYTTITEPVGYAKPGQTRTYTVSIYNAGSDTLPANPTPTATLWEWYVAIVLPPDMTYVSSSRGAYEGSASNTSGYQWFVWYPTTGIAPGGGITFTVNASVNSEAVDTQLIASDFFIDLDYSDLVDADTSDDMDITSLDVTQQINVTYNSANGSVSAITPSGPVAIPNNSSYYYLRGGDHVFQFTPTNGNQVTTVTVDSSSIGKTNSYTFKNLLLDHTLDIQFGAITSYTYYFTWNDTTSGRQAWNLVANPSTTDTAHVTIKIGGATYNYTLAPGQMVTPLYPNRQQGPVVITSDIKVVTTQRVNLNGSFNEMADIPAE